METITNIRQWGNSLGIMIPKEKLRNEDININDEVIVVINKKITKVKDIMGKLNKTIDTAKALKEIDEMFEE